MDVVAPADYRVRDNWIFFPHKLIEPVQIPFGLRLYPRPRLRIVTDGSTIQRLWVEVSNSWRRVLPAFSRDIPASGHHIAFRIDAVVADWQRSVGRALVSRTHYLMPRAGGFMLLATLKDASRGEELRSQWWAKQSPSARVRLGSSARLGLGGLGQTIGMLQLERLVHGHPAGRSDVFRREGKKPPTMPTNKRDRRGFRSNVVATLGLHWISRVAVDGPFQNQGVGSALCDAAREISSGWLLHPGRYVELIRRIPVSHLERLLLGEGDFLVGMSPRFGRPLPFKLFGDSLSRRPATIWNQDLGRSDLVLPTKVTPRPARDCLVYYYAKAGRMTLSGTGASSYGEQV